MLPPAQQAQMEAERAALDPFALNAVIESAVRAVLAMPHNSVRPRPHKPSSQQPPVTLSKKAIAMKQRRKNAPVRSYVAR